MANYMTQCRKCGSYFGPKSATNLCYDCLEKELSKTQRALELACKESISCPIEAPGDCINQEYYNCADCCKKYYLEQVEKEGEA